MALSSLPIEEIERRALRLYAESIRASVEKEPNIGKLVTIDVGSGDYEIGDDRDFDAPSRLQQRHPGAQLFALRIGYDAVYALGGVIHRTQQP